LTFVREENMEFGDWLFARANGLPCSEGPTPAGESGPSEPGVMARFHEQVVFDHAMGKTSSAGAEEIPLPLLEKLLAPRDSRDNPRNGIAALAKLFDVPGQRIMPVVGGDLAKRFSGHDGDPTRAVRIERTHFQSGDVVAELDERGVVIKTYFEPAA
jgi:hypothetical protein